MDDIILLLILSSLLVIYFTAVGKGWSKSEWFIAILLSCGATPIIGFPAVALLRWIAGD
ncbi:MAG: hypothetical protein J1E02_06130 [Coprobacter sp.]|nr:hypothetical protein [Coprobacter sp.]